MKHSIKISLFFLFSSTLVWGSLSYAALAPTTTETQDKATYVPPATTDSKNTIQTSPLPVAKPAPIDGIAKQEWDEVTSPTRQQTEVNPIPLRICTVIQYQGDNIDATRDGPANYCPPGYGCMGLASTKCVWQHGSDRVVYESDPACRRGSQNCMIAAF